MENPIKMDDLGGPPLFLETSTFPSFQNVVFFGTPKRRFRSKPHRKDDIEVHKGQGCARVMEHIWNLREAKDPERCEANIRNSVYINELLGGWSSFALEK